jgi:hypothetical protein
LPYSSAYADRRPEVSSSRRRRACQVRIMGRTHRTWSGSGIDRRG